MPDSILTYIKKLLGIDDADTSFDMDIIVHINSALMTLNQLGVGPAEGFAIADKSDTWSQFLGGATNLEGVKSYVYLRVRLMFDPPTSSFTLEAMDRQAKEFEWRLNAQIEPPYVEPVVVETEVW